MGTEPIGRKAEAAGYNYAKSERSKQATEITAENMVTFEEVCTSEENISHALVLQDWAFLS